MKLDVGCGTDKKQGFTGLDISKLPGVDIVADIQKSIPLKDNSVEEIYCVNVLQHIPNWKTSLNAQSVKSKGDSRIIGPTFYSQ